MRHLFRRPGRYLYLNTIVEGTAAGVVLLATSPNNNGPNPTRFSFQQTTKPKYAALLKRPRMFVLAGFHDTYYPNEGVAQSQHRTDAIEPGWANVTILPDRPYGATYNNLPLWDFLELLYSWIVDHAPEGPTPLSADIRTSCRTRERVGAGHRLWSS